MIALLGNKFDNRLYGPSSVATEVLRPCFLCLIEETLRARETSGPVILATRPIQDHLESALHWQCSASLECRSSSVREFATFGVSRQLLSKLGLMSRC